MISSWQVQVDMAYASYEEYELVGELFLKMPLLIQLWTTLSFSHIYRLPNRSLLCHLNIGF